MNDEIDLQLHTVPPDRGSMSDQPKWRRDFAIDTAEDNYHARRDFTKFLVLTSFAFVVGQFWIALQNLWRKGRGAPPLKRIALLSDLQVGGSVAFHYPTDTDPALLIRVSDETLVAYENQCTHLQCPVLPEIETGKLHCPCHAGYFDLLNGAVLAGPPRRPLPRLRLEVRRGVVYAVGIEEARA